MSLESETRSVALAGIGWACAVLLAAVVIGLFAVSNDLWLCLRHPAGSR